MVVSKLIFLLMWIRRYSFDAAAISQVLFEGFIPSLNDVQQDEFEKLMENVLSIIKTIFTKIIIKIFLKILIY